MGNLICKTLEEVLKKSSGPAYFGSKKIIIEGIIQKYIPLGIGMEIWDYRILFDDNKHIIVQTDKNENRILLRNFINHKVIAEAWIFYGIVYGEPEGQHAIGYRIDICDIKQ
jgi:hypothetical protein